MKKLTKEENELLNMIVSIRKGGKILSNCQHKSRNHGNTQNKGVDNNANINNFYSSEREKTSCNS